MISAGAANILISTLETSVLDDARAPTRSTSFIVAGEVVYEDGRVTRVDRDAALRELHYSLQQPPADELADSNIAAC